MGLLKGTLSLRHLTTTKDLPENYNAAYTAEIDRLAIREPDQPRAGEIFGWCHPDDMLNVDHPSTDWIVGPYGRLCLRIDSRKVPTARVHAELGSKIKAWCAENDRKRCPSQVRAEIKDQIVDNMLRQIMPKTKLVHAIWDMSEGRIVLDSVSEKTVECFRSLFRQTFGLEIGIYNPNTELSQDTLTALVGTMETSLQDAPERSAPGDGQLPLPDDACVPRFTLVSDLLLWMWFRAEHEPEWIERTFNGMIFWVDDRIVLDDESGKVVVTGENAATDKAALAALLAGKTPTEIRFCFRIEDLEYTATMRGLNLDWISAKMPPSTGDDDEAQLYERVFLFDKLHVAIVDVFQTFARARGSAAWVTWVREIQTVVRVMHAMNDETDAKEA